MINLNLLVFVVCFPLNQLSYKTYTPVTSSPTCLQLLESVQTPTSNNFSKDWTNL